MSTGGSERSAESVSATVDLRGSGGVRVTSESAQVVGGAISVRSPDARAVGNSGVISISSGTSSEGNSGSLLLLSGDSLSGSSGDLFLHTGRDHE